MGSSFVMGDQKDRDEALEEIRAAAKEAVVISKEALDVSKKSAEQMASANDASAKAYEAARLAYEASRSGLSTLTTMKNSQDTACADIQVIKKEEQKKSKVPTILAAVLNLLVALVWIILELIRMAAHR